VVKNSVYLGSSLPFSSCIPNPFSAVVHEHKTTSFEQSLTIARYLPKPTTIVIDTKFKVWFEYQQCEVTRGEDKMILPWITVFLAFQNEKLLTVIQPGEGPNLEFNKF
jgi:hypothetical protein